MENTVGVKNVLVKGYEREGEKKSRNAIENENIGLNEIEKEAWAMMSIL